MLFSDSSCCVVDNDVDCSTIESATLLFIEDCLAIVVCNGDINAVVVEAKVKRLATKYLILDNMFTDYFILLLISLSSLIKRRYPSRRCQLYYSIIISILISSLVYDSHLQ